MSAIATNVLAPPCGGASPFLRDELLSPRGRSPRRPLEPWCQEIVARLERDEARPAMLALCFDEAARIALSLERPADARRLHAAAVSALVARAEEGGRGASALALALHASLSRANVDAALGDIDGALFAFERIAALPLGGSFEDGPLVVTQSRFVDIAAFASQWPGTLYAEAIVCALDALILARRLDVALSVARARSPHESPAFVALRREATATALSRMGLFDEALVFLASAVAREPLSTRPIFEQKRAEALAAAGKVDAAAARASLVLDMLDERFRCAPASLDDLALAARASRLLTMLGWELPAALCVRAFDRAAASGDVPLEAEFALTVVSSGAPRTDRERAAEALTRLAGESGYRIAGTGERPRGCFEAARPEVRAPSYLGLRDRLLALSA